MRGSFPSERLTDLKFLLIINLQKYPKTHAAVHKAPCTYRTTHLKRLLTTKIRFDFNPSIITVNLKALPERQPLAVFCTCDISLISGLKAMN